MRQWALLEQVVGDVFVDTGARTDADTWGRAVEAFLPAELCASQTITCALMLDTLLADLPPNRQNIRTRHGIYQVVALADDAPPDVVEELDRHTATTLDYLRHEGIAP